MLTKEDTAIIENLTFGSFALSEMGQIQDGDARDARIMKRCAEARARSHSGDWQHNVGARGGARVMPELKILPAAPLTDEDVQAWAHVMLRDRSTAETLHAWDSGERADRRDAELMRNPTRAEKT